MKPIARTWAAAIGCVMAAAMAGNPVSATTGGGASSSDTTPRPAATADIDQLLARFAKAPGLYARFREEKHIALLETPVASQGTIHFVPPGRFVRHTQTPVESTLLIDGSRLQFGDADGRQSVDLGTNPVAKLFVDSFVMILSGNRAGLERVFTIKLNQTGSGGGATWRLTLLPRVAPMDKVIKEIVLVGSGLALRELEIRESSGDWSRTVFSDVDVARRYTPAEQERIFRLPTR